MFDSWTKEKGLSLVELMVASTVFMVMAAGTVVTVRSVNTGMDKTKAVVIRDFLAQKVRHFASTPSVMAFSALDSRNENKDFKTCTLGATLGTMCLQGEKPFILSAPGFTTAQRTDVAGTENTPQWYDLSGDPCVHGMKPDCILRASVSFSPECETGTSCARALGVNVRYTIRAVDPHNILKNMPIRPLSDSVFMNVRAIEQAKSIAIGASSGGAGCKDGTRWVGTDQYGKPICEWASPMCNANTEVLIGITDAGSPLCAPKGRVVDCWTSQGNFLVGIQADGKGVCGNLPAPAITNCKTLVESSANCPNGSVTSYHYEYKCKSFGCKHINKVTCCYP